MKPLLHLMKKEFLLEFRQGYALGGIVLYVFSMVFVVYIASIRADPRVWNILFWLIVLFASINAVVKSFVQESGSRQLYYYQIADPITLLFAKIFYNTILLLVLTSMALLAYSTVAANPIRDWGLFSLVLVLSSLGFGITFTFLSAIAARANNSSTLMAILSFPVVLPILMPLMRLSILAIGLETDTSFRREIYTLLAIDGILLAVAYLLFPSVWKD